MLRLLRLLRMQRLTRVRPPGNPTPGRPLVRSSTIWAPHLPAKTILAALTGMDESAVKFDHRQATRCTACRDGSVNYPAASSPRQSSGTDNAKGYEAADLFDAWQRYLSPLGPRQPMPPPAQQHPQHPVPDALRIARSGDGVLDDVHRDRGPCCVPVMTGRVIRAATRGNVPGCGPTDHPAMPPSHSVRPTRHAPPYPLLRLGADGPRPARRRSADHPQG